MKTLNYQWRNLISITRTRIPQKICERKLEINMRKSEKGNINFFFTSSLEQPRNYMELGILVDSECGHLRNC